MDDRCIKPSEQEQFLMDEYGMTRGQAQALMRCYTEGEIRAAVVRLREESKNKHIVNKGAYLVALLKNGVTEKRDMTEDNAEQADKRRLSIAERDRQTKEMLDLQAATKSTKEVGRAGFAACWEQQKVGRESYLNKAGRANK